MSIVQKERERGEGLPPNLHARLKNIVDCSGVNGALFLIDKVAAIQGVSAVEDPIAMKFLIREIAFAVEDIPHWSGREVVVIAYGVRPVDSIAFITAACGVDRQITWYARPVTVSGSEVTEISRNWYEDGRDRCDC